jgi:hypothetical protein
MDSIISHQLVIKYQINFLHLYIKHVLMKLFVSLSYRRNRSCSLPFSIHHQCLHLWTWFLWKIKMRSWLKNHITLVCDCFIHRSVRSANIPLCWSAPLLNQTSICWTKLHLQLSKFCSFHERFFTNNTTIKGIYHMTKCFYWCEQSITINWKDTH